MPQYPFEFAKTNVQLQNNYGTNNPLRIIYNIAQSQGATALYTGCTTLMVGTTAKAAVRFLAFDTIKSKLVDSNGKLSPGRGIIAGMGAGVVESVLAVTPSERIKTALIDDAKGERRFRNGFHAARVLVQEKGFRACYQGLAATTLKQSATSAVRMGSYNILKERAKAQGRSITLPQQLSWVPLLVRSQFMLHSHLTPSKQGHNPPKGQLPYKRSTV